MSHGPVHLPPNRIVPNSWAAAVQQQPPAWVLKPLPPSLHAPSHLTCNTLSRWTRACLQQHNKLGAAPDYLQLPLPITPCCKLVIL